MLLDVVESGFRVGLAPTHVLELPVSMIKLTLYLACQRYKIYYLEEILTSCFVGAKSHRSNVSDELKVGRRSADNRSLGIVTLPRPADTKASSAGLISFQEMLRLSSLTHALGKGDADEVIANDDRFRGDEESEEQS